jgi:hypothetical protein
MKDSLEECKHLFSGSRICIGFSLKQGVCQKTNLGKEESRSFYAVKSNNYGRVSCGFKDLNGLRPRFWEKCEVRYH